METFKKCKVGNCKNKQKYLKKGYCNRHYLQIKKHGKILKRTRFDPNEIIDCGNYYEICFYNKNQKEIGRTKIDREDLEKVKNYKWHIDKWGYIATTINNKILKLHHLILGKPPIGYEVDHRFGDKLDNRKSKLRFATHQQNGVNRKSKGYCWHKGMNKWMIYITVNKKYILLGYVINEEEAIKIRKEAEQKYYGEFAYKF